MDVDERAPGHHRQFEILVVCTANLCRSPMLEGLLRAELAAADGTWTVTSAGTHAVEGQPVHPSTAQALAALDITLPDGWHARELGPVDVARADLVLTASRSHRTEVLRTDPRASSRTFTVRQFLRLLATPGVEASDHVVAHPGERLLDTALAARGLGPPVAPELDDIPDPVGRPYPVFRDLAVTLAAELRGFTTPAESTHPPAVPAAARAAVPATRPAASWRPLPRWASRSS